MPPTTSLSPASRRLPSTLRFIALVQLLLGLPFLLDPAATARLLGLSPAPGWANWMFGMMAARFLGYAAGLELAARNPRGHASMITTMILIQAVDWIVTLLHLAQGDVTLRQVSTAAFFPVLFIALLLLDRRQWLTPAQA